MSKPKRGRPPKFTDAARVCVRPSGDSQLKKHSDRRAIVDWLVEEGGCSTLGAIDRHFGFTMRAKVFALQRAGWLDVTE